MASKTMPPTLMVLVALLGLGVVLNLVDGFIVSAVLGGALLFGLVAGNDGVRKFMQFLAGIQILWNSILIVRAVGASAGNYVLWGIIGIVLPAFMIWTLAQPNVREWMFRKNFNLDGVSPQDPPPAL